MPFIEAPTTFYLGRRYDQRTDQLAEDIVYYDSRDLTTHAVVVGMTGSGKTGLCITMLEEAILDNIPAIIIDPKGDITNLVLNFPDLRPQDFQPWVNVDDARRAGMEVNTYAADVAQRWRDGLFSWGIVPDRLRWLQVATQYSIYTPGSDAGLPISILASLRAPREGWLGNEEALREKINGITTALLALAGISAEPVKDPRHVLIANIFEFGWQRGVDLTLEDIILQVQKPPFEKLGVLPIDKFMTEKKRFELSMELNNIIAAPSFQSWIQGQSLDIQSLLYQPNGRPRVSIFYIAHLNESERMFMMTLLLENMLGWMRTLSGTTSLRAILYIDEMFGYFPPAPRNPPSKDPMLRLLKQARAFGIGLIMATQNPGDLDYKGLSNTGTWFIGRLQSENDKKKVMDGLRSMADATEDMSMDDVDRLIADIKPRVFLMRNVHDDGGPTLVHSRWAMSYLRGPLTRQQISWLMQGQRQQLLAQLAYAQQYPPAPQQAMNWHQNPAFTQQSAPPAGLPGMPGVPAGLPGLPPSGLPGLPGTPAATHGGFAAYAAAPYPGMPTEYTGQPPAPTGGYAPMPNPGGFTGGYPPMPPQPTAPMSFTAQTAPVQPTGATTPVSTGGAPAGYSTNRPPVSSTTAQYFLPNRLTQQQAITEWERRTGFQAQNRGQGTLVYQPGLLAQIVVRYQDRKASIYTARTFTYFVPDLQRAGLVRWEEHLIGTLDGRSLSSEPFGQALFGDLPGGLIDAARVKALQTELVDMLYNTALLTIPYNPDLKIYGSPDEDFSVYQANVQQVAREKRDLEVEKLAKKFGELMHKLEDKRRKKEMELQNEKKEVRSRRREQVFTAGEAAYSLLNGRPNYTLSRISASSRRHQQTKDDLDESYVALDEIDAEMDKLEQEYEGELQRLNERWGVVISRVQDYVINPYKKDIQVELYGIGWRPSWLLQVNGQTTSIDAS